MAFQFALHTWHDQPNFYVAPKFMRWPKPPKAVDQSKIVGTRIQAIAIPTQGEGGQY